MKTKSVTITAATNPTREKIRAAEGLFTSLNLLSVFPQNLTVIAPDGVSDEAMTTYVNALFSKWLGHDVTRKLEDAKVSLEALLEAYRVMLAVLRAQFNTPELTIEFDEELFKRVCPDEIPEDEHERPEEPVKQAKVRSTTSTSTKLGAVRTGAQVPGMGGLKAIVIAVVIVLGGLFVWLIWPDSEENRETVAERTETELLLRELPDIEPPADSAAGRGETPSPAPTKPDSGTPAPETSSPPAQETADGGDDQPKKLEISEADNNVLNVMMRLGWVQPVDGSARKGHLMRIEQAQTLSQQWDGGRIGIACYVGSLPKAEHPTDLDGWNKINDERYQPLVRELKGALGNESIQGALGRLSKTYPQFFGQ